jgi:hypothetical protein
MVTQVDLVRIVIRRVGDNTKWSVMDLRFAIREFDHNAIAARLCYDEMNVLTVKPFSFMPSLALRVIPAQASMLERSKGHAF